MTTSSIRDRVIKKLKTLSEQQLEYIWQTIQTWESEPQTIESDRHKEELSAKFDRLCRETQALHGENPITNEEIQAEINAYRREK